MSVIGIVALLAYGLLSKGSSTRIDDALASGKPAPISAFDLPVLEPGHLAAAPTPKLGLALKRGRVGSHDLRGTPTVINFWASWCPPCREEAPVLEEGWKRFGPQGVLFLGIDMQDLSGDARDFLRRFDITYPSVRDRGSSVAHDFGAAGIPETYFVSAQGKAVAHVIGAVSQEGLAGGVQAALSGSVAGTVQGGDRRAQR